jgi:hypothetical protein
MLTQQDRVTMITRAKTMLGQGPKSELLVKEGVISRGPNTHTKGWCGDFVTWNLMRAGVNSCKVLNRYDLCNKWATGQNIARLYAWAEATGSKRKEKTSAEPGDIICVPRGDGDHVGLLVEITGNNFTTIDGNSWGGVVYINQRPISNNYRMIINVECMPTGRQGSYELDDYINKHRGTSADNYGYYLSSYTQMTEGDGDEYYS